MDIIFPEDLLPREIFKTVTPFLEEENIVLLTGARQTGKTSLLYLLIRYLWNNRIPPSQIVYFDLENIHDLSQLSGLTDFNEFWQILRDKGINREKRVFVFVDEIQHLPNPSSFLKYLHDHHKPNLKFIVTGSSSLEIKKKFTDRLTGRVYRFVVKPLSFHEFLEFKHEKALAEMLADSNDANMVGLVEEGLKAIPTTSRTYEVITDVLNWYLEDANDGELDWRATRSKLYDYYQGAYDYGRYYLWIESTINTGATVLAILYGQADFKETVQIGILAGWDCDCNPATAGGLIGIIGGYSGLPNDLTDPNICGNVYKNVYRPYLPDPNLYRPQYDTITNIASRLTALAERNILDNGGYITGSGPTKTYHIPDNGAIVGEPEKGDPDGPTGLVAEALDAAITVTTSAAVEYHYSTSDRRNLDSIINGITDNSYNGHRAYYSYLYDPNARPELDWYQLNFSQPVKFETMTFYDGVVFWSSINTYYINDDTSGGFFNDLTLEILRDGRFIEPANLEMSPALDRFKMYQTITFTFSPTVGDAIRIIGTAGGTRNYTTIMELAVTGDIDPGLYVAAVEIANDQLQRSSVAEVAVAFSNDVTITPDDIELAGTTNGTGFSEDQINFIYDSFSYQLTLEFDMDNDANFGDSLPDDTYQLRLDCNCITDPCSQTLLDDDSDPEDGFYTIEFHALYGDADGSAVVDLSDLALLGGCWLDNAGDTGLDWNADNIVNLPDLAHFADNWLSWFTY